jgi:hypothetical protein
MNYMVNETTMKLTQVLKQLIKAEPLEKKDFGGAMFPLSCKLV